MRIPFFLLESQVNVLNYFTLLVYVKRKHLSTPSSIMKCQEHTTRQLEHAIRGHSFFIGCGQANQKRVRQKRFFSVVSDDCHRQDDEAFDLDWR